jgi:hypothetical protein
MQAELGQGRAIAGEGADSVIELALLSMYGRGGSRQAGAGSLAVSYIETLAYPANVMQIT